MLPPAADLVKRQARKRAKKGKARRKREKERQHVIAERQPGNEQPDNRINDAKEQNVISASA